jgi:hypothetical protein
LLWKLWNSWFRICSTLTSRLSGLFERQFVNALKRFTNKFARYKGSESAAWIELGHYILSAAFAAWRSTRVHMWLSRMESAVRKQKKMKLWECCKKVFDCYKFVVIANNALLTSELLLSHQYSHERLARLKLFGAPRWIVRLDCGDSLKLNPFVSISRPNGLESETQ